MPCDRQSESREMNLRGSKSMSSVYSYTVLGCLEILAEVTGLWLRIPGRGGAAKISLAFNKQNGRHNRLPWLALLLAWYRSTNAQLHNMRPYCHRDRAVFAMSAFHQPHCSQEVDQVRSSWLLKHWEVSIFFTQQGSDLREPCGVYWAVTLKVGQLPCLWQILAVLSAIDMRALACIFDVRPCGPVNGRYDEPS